jgi:cobalamin biosynthesis protein CobW
MSRIPVTVITGFLGAGKTTLLRALLTQTQGKRIGVIVNEFGEVGFDGGLVKDCADEACVDGEFVELTNGCICCTVADDFIPTMNKLLSREEPLDAIVIETSGLALPQPLLKAFAWPDIRTRTTVDGVVTVVDAVALSQGRVAIDEAALDAQRSADPSLDHDDPIEEVFEDQLACADLVVVSKSDLVTAPALSDIERKLGRALRSNVRVVRSRGALAPHVLIGLGAAAENDLSARTGHHGEDEEHNHDDFESIVVSPTATTADDLKARVGKALGLDGILRIKGYAEVKDKTAAAVVQAVGDRIEISFARPDAAPKPGIVVIGLKGFDQAAARAALTD